MHPLTLLIPALIIVTGIVTFTVLPLELPVRIAILGSDLIAALIVGSILARRFHSK